ncbi:MAG: ThuA domain-containing protein [Planctomycetaceae bacterium]
MRYRILFCLSSVFLVAASLVSIPACADDTLVFEPAHPGDHVKHVVLISGDEEYRSEETMPMLGKILSQKHGFKCTVLFAFGPDGAEYIDPNNQQGLRGLEALDSADLLIVATRFRRPDAMQARHITSYLDAGKPVIGLRTATHAFQGKEEFGDALTYDEFGRKILGEQWVSHHGKHKVEGARSVTEPGAADHVILSGVSEIFAPSDVYGVTHLTAADTILLRGAITESLDPASKTLVDDPRNKPMQPLAWLHTYTAPNGKTGRSFCTTAGASLDFVDEDLRRLIVNAAIELTGGQVPKKADVDFIDPFYPTFFCFINDPAYYKTMNMKPQDFGLGKAPHRPDPPGNPAWPYRPTPQE